jgi:hypothetical protein
MTMTARSSWSDPSFNVICSLASMGSSDDIDDDRYDYDEDLDPIWSLSPIINSFSTVSVAI